MKLLSDSRYTDHNPQYTASSYQQTKGEDHHAGRLTSSCIHPRRQGGSKPLRTATIDYGGQEQISRRKDLLWFIARLVKGDNQRILNWTGFNIKFHSHEPVKQDVVGYLPTLSAPVTQLSTVN